MTEADLEEVFGHIPLILKLSTELLKEFKTRIESWKHDSLIGDVFVRMGPHLKMYSVYCQTHRASVNKLNALTRKSPELQRFLHSARKEAGQMDVGAFLILPVQRIPRYLLLLRQIHDNTPSDHPDLQSLTQAMAVVSEVADHVNEFVRSSQNSERLFEIQSSITGLDQDIVAPRRRFIMEGSLTKISSRAVQRRQFFLFNDSLVYAAPGMNKMKFKGRITLNTAWVKSLPDSKAAENAFMVICPDKTYTLTCPTVEEKNVWVAAIETQISALVKQFPGLIEQRGELRIHLRDGIWTQLNPANAAIAKATGASDDQRPVSIGAYHNRGRHTATVGGIADLVDQSDDSRFVLRRKKRQSTRLLDALAGDEVVLPPAPPVSSEKKAGVFSRLIGGLSRESIYKKKETVRLAGTRIQLEEQMTKLEKTLSGLQLLQSQFTAIGRPEREAPVKAEMEEVKASIVRLQQQLDRDDVDPEPTATELRESLDSEMRKRDALNAMMLLYVGRPERSAPVKRQIDDTEKKMIELEEKMQQLGVLESVGRSTKARAFAAWTATEDDQIDLIEGDVVEVSVKHADGWWMGKRRRDGAIGLFPGNYVDLIEDKKEKAPVTVVRKTRPAALSSPIMPSKKLFGGASAPAPRPRPPKAAGRGIKVMDGEKDFRSLLKKRVE